MNIIRLNIRSKLAIASALFTIIVTGLAGWSIASLHKIDNATETLNVRLVDSSHLLGKMSDRVSEFRLAEAYRALGTDTRQRASAEALADSHAKVIDTLLEEYATKWSKGDTAVATQAFRSAWNDYCAAHTAWIKSDANGTAEDPARYGSALHRLYRTADDAAEGLIDANRGVALAEHGAVDRLIDETMTIMYAAVAIAVLFGVMAIVLAQTTIARPLAAITRALSRLAAGDRDVAIPELGRTDEIGQMAGAFDVFRANAVALEKAHAATREAQAQAQALARHDALTGLPNRRLFSAELQNGLARANKGMAACAVMIMDLDQFKQVNDLQGHAVGDVVLCEIAGRLRDLMRKDDIVARLGGDEFAVIVETDLDRGPSPMMGLAARILASVREPILVGESRIEMSASIGIAICPTDGADAETVMRAADLAMYRAKQEGRNAFRFFVQSMDEELRAQAGLEADLRKAIVAGEIKPQYQPLIEMADQRVFGFEVLARWNHPIRGNVPPDVFIPIAEQLGLISDLTVSILTQACREARRWDQTTTISVNISPLQLKDASLPTQILSILNRENFPPSRLEIEVTETALVSDIDTAKEILTALQSVGIKISLDDFGTGYSSLYHLRALSFDKVKIDRSFVQSMGENGESEKIVDAILSLAKSIGLPTVAEGIENDAVMQLLTEKGCEFGQGYFLGKAMTALKVEELLDNREREITLGRVA